MARDIRRGDRKLKDRKVVMVGMIDKALSWLASNANHAPLSKTWSNIRTPSAAYYNLGSITIPAYSQYLIIASNGNGQTGAVVNSCRPVISSGTAKESHLFTGLNNTGAGNLAYGFGYIETGSTSCVLTIQCYGYNTSVTNMNGRVIAIPLARYLGGA